jgi:hypothetical protein
MPLVPVLWLRDAAVAKAAERTSATTARVSRWRKLAVLAGAGLALLAGAGLAVAGVHAPTHRRIPATTAYTLPTPQLPWSRPIANTGTRPSRSRSASTSRRRRSRSSSQRPRRRACRR